MITIDQVWEHLYGKDTRRQAFEIISQLAPLTRRDSFWTDELPFEIVARCLKKIKDEIANS